MEASEGGWLNSPNEVKEGACVGCGSGGERWRGPRKGEPRRHVPQEGGQLLAVQPGSCSQHC